MYYPDWDARLLSTGLELMTLALSEPRATNCAKRAADSLLYAKTWGDLYPTPECGLGHKSLGYVSIPGPGETGEPTLGWKEGSGGMSE